MKHTDRRAAVLGAMAGALGTDDKSDMSVKLSAQKLKS